MFLMLLNHLFIVLSFSFSCFYVHASTRHILVEYSGHVFELEHEQARTLKKCMRKGLLSKQGSLKVWKVWQVLVKVYLP